IVLAKGAERRILSNLVEQFNILAPYQGRLIRIDINGKTKQEREDTVLTTCKSLIGEITDESSGNIVSVLSESVDLLKQEVAEQISPDENHRISVLESRLSEQFKQKSKTDK